MISVDDARSRIVGALAPLPAVELPLPDALGLTLAESIVAGFDLPPFANSAMDGYAVRSADLTGASVSVPVALTVTGSAMPGALPARGVDPGGAVRIMTGAPVPPGADAVVPFEDVEEVASERISLRRSARVGENIRPAGEDVAAGEEVLAAGRTLRPFEIGVLAALGREQAPIHRRPLVAILSTGDELVAPGEALAPGRLYDSNGPMLAALTARAGGQPVSLGVAADTLPELRARLDRAGEFDLIVTSGGISTGDADLVKELLRAEGSLDLWQVRMRPGRPLAFGRLRGRPLIGLPGNPVAAAVAFAQFAYPAIRTLLGHDQIELPAVQATLLDRVENRGGRRSFVRVRVESIPGGYSARVVGKPGAGMIGSLALANGFLIVPEDLPVAEPGNILPVQLLDAR